MLHASRAQLNVRATLLRKQLAQLEQELQHTLFSFQGSALSLTREGQQLQAKLIALANERKLPVIEQPLIRLAVAESILHDILGRDLIALLRRNASVRLEIIALDSELSLRAVSADIVLWLAHGATPHPGPTFATSEPQALARLDYLPHIAKRYSRVTARPDTPTTSPTSCWCNGSMIGKSTVFVRGMSWLNSGWPGWCRCSLMS